MTGISKVERKYLTKLLDLGLYERYLADEIFLELKRSILLNRPKPKRTYNTDAPIRDAVLTAIMCGKTRRKDIAHAAHCLSPNISSQLDKLMELREIERVNIGQYKYIGTE